VDRTYPLLPDLLGLRLQALAVLHNELLLCGEIAKRIRLRLGSALSLCLALLGRGLSSHGSRSGGRCIVLVTSLAFLALCRRWRGR